MTNHVFHTLKAIAKRLTILLVSVLMLLSLMPTTVLAAPSRSVETGAAPGITEPIPDENVSEMKAQRREWQSKASSVNDAKNDESSSLGETVKEKLNLDEITEGYHPEKAAEKDD